MCQNASSNINSEDNATFTQMDTVENFLELEEKLTDEDEYKKLVYYQKK